MHGRFLAWPACTLAVLIAGGPSATAIAQQGMAPAYSGYPVTEDTLTAEPGHRFSTPSYHPVSNSLMSMDEYQSLADGDWTFKYASVKGKK